MTKAATPQQYDPLDYDNLAQNVVRALMEQPCQNLAPAPFGRRYSGQLSDARIAAILRTALVLSNTAS